MTFMTEEFEHRVSREVLHYLLNQPHAKDNVQGIVQWWLLKERIDYSVELISSILDKLESEGFLVSSYIAGGQKYYEINEDRLTDIRRLVAEPD